MEIETHSINFKTNGGCDIIDITGKVETYSHEIKFR